MNNLVKAGEVMKLKDLIQYEDGSISNLDVASNPSMKFVLMAFDAGTGLTPHRAPGNAIIFALEGKATIGYEGKDYVINAGENFRFEKTDFTVSQQMRSSRWLYYLLLSKYL